MTIFSAPHAFRASGNGIAAGYQTSYPSGLNLLQNAMLPPADIAAKHPALGHLTLLVFEAVLEVVCVSLPGYIIARQGMFDAEMQKFLANLNVMLFTPCLIFTKLASQLTAEKLADLAVIPVIFVVQTLVSYVCAITVAKLFGFAKRQKNFVVAMGVFGNSNSLPISLVISLSQTISGLHWDKIPGDNDDEVAARGILYLLIFQQLGQLVRWSWGYHVLLAPPEAFHDNADDEGPDGRLERGDPASPEIQGNGVYGDSSSQDLPGRLSLEPDSNDHTPVNYRAYASSACSSSSTVNYKASRPNGAHPPVFQGDSEPSDDAEGYPSSELSDSSPLLVKVGRRGQIAIKTFPRRVRNACSRSAKALGQRVSSGSRHMFERLPISVQNGLRKTGSLALKFLYGLWEFMNPPLWAMLVAIIVATVPALQRAFFTEGTFVQNSITRAVKQSGGVAVPLILVVLGANLARNTLPNKTKVDKDQEKEDRKLLIASIISRMLLPTIIMAPILALAARYVPISILDDPIFVVVCFLLTGAPSALQLAQICQINGVFESAMSKLLFQSYVIWILPSTLVLVMTALEVLRWAG